MSARADYPSASTNARPNGVYVPLSRANYHGAMDEIDALRVERDTLTAAVGIRYENEMVLSRRCAALEAEKRAFQWGTKLDGWYWCTTDAEFVSAARRCPTSDPTLCRLVAIYAAGGSDTIGETPQ